MIEVVMSDERYASIKQLMDLAADGKWVEVEYLLKTYQYSRYAVSQWRRLLSDNAPTSVYRIVQDYHDSAMETL